MAAQRALKSIALLFLSSVIEFDRIVVVWNFFRIAVFVEDLGCHANDASFFCSFNFTVGIVDNFISFGCADFRWIQNDSEGATLSVSWRLLLRIFGYFWSLGYSRLVKERWGYRLLSCYNLCFVDRCIYLLGCNNLACIFLLSFKWLLLSSLKWNFLCFVHSSYHSIVFHLLSLRSHGHGHVIAILWLSLHALCFIKLCLSSLFSNFL